VTRSADTFVHRALLRFGVNVRRGFSVAERRHRRAVEAAKGRLEGIKWLARHKQGSFVGLAALLWLVSTLYMFIAQRSFQYAIGVVVVSATLGLLAAFSVWVLGHKSGLRELLEDSIEFATGLVLFVSVIVWMAVYALWQAVIVFAKLLLLVPLCVLFAATRLTQLWRGIFFTCPARHCSYRGLPAYVCSNCGTGNAKLWPNLIGLLWHPCTNCGERLPTLDILGRKRLGKLCGGDGMPLLGHRADRAPERLVAIVSGPGSGKTSYLLMAVHLMTQGGGWFSRSEIDDPAQEGEFRREWAKLETGTAAAKTAGTTHAFLMYTRVGGLKCQLYLYDAPGEELASIGSMTRQQYFPLLEGLVMLVDPLDLDGFQRIVTSTVATAMSVTNADRSGKLPLRAAVVISKADKKIVKDVIGDVTLGAIPQEKCRAALIAWGARNAIMALESHFEAVDYFACSPLGRGIYPRSLAPFQGYGLLEPLKSVLGGSGPPRGKTGKA